jgi:osmotically-inducible protein OsmY
MTTQELQQEIDRTRERLGDTVEELASRADLKARARGKAAEVKVKAQDKATELSGRVRRSQAVQRRWPLAVAAGVVVAGAVAVRRWRRA